MHNCVNSLRRVYVKMSITYFWLRVLPLDCWAKLTRDLVVVSKDACNYGFEMCILAIGI